MAFSPPYDADDVHGWEQVGGLALRSGIGRKEESQLYAVALAMWPSIVPSSSISEFLGLLSCRWRNVSSSAAQFSLYKTLVPFVVDLYIFASFTACPFAIR